MRQKLDFFALLDLGHINVDEAAALTGLLPAEIGVELDDTETATAVRARVAEMRLNGTGVELAAMNLLGSAALRIRDIVNDPATPASVAIRASAELRELAALRARGTARLAAEFAQKPTRVIFNFIGMEASGAAETVVLTPMQDVLTHEVRGDAEEFPNG